MGGQEVHVFGRHDLCEVKGLDLFQRLQNGLVRREDQCVVAVTLVLLEFVAQQELVEDAGRHQDRLAGPHGQREDVVGVDAGVLAHRRKDGLVLLLRDLVEKVALTVVADDAAFFAASEPTLLFEPVLEDLFDLGVVHELLEEDIDLERFELWLAQEGLGVLVRIVEVQELAGQFLVVGADGATVRAIELPEEVEKGEVERGAGRLGAPSHWSRSLPSIPREGR